MFFGFDRQGLIIHNLITLLYMGINGEKRGKLANLMVQIKKEVREATKLV